MGRRRQKRLLLLLIIILGLYWIFSVYNNFTRMNRIRERVAESFEEDRQAQRQNLTRPKFDRFQIDSSVVTDFMTFQLNLIPEMNLEEMKLLKKYSTIDNVPWSKALGSSRNFLHYKSNSECSVKRPEFKDILFGSERPRIWQILKLPLKFQTPNFLFLYGAYVDTRLRLWNKRTQIRIIFAAERYLENDVQLFCQFWTDKSNGMDPVFSEISSVQYMWKEDWGLRGEMHPYLATCSLPPLPPTSIGLFESVSIVAGNFCTNATNDLRLIYELPQDNRSSSLPNEIGLCVKALEFQEGDFSLRMIEWAEMQKIMGISRIHLNYYKVHRNLAKVIKYYYSQGFIRAKPFLMPGNYEPALNVKYWVEWRLELIQFNDCFLRNMYKYRFLSPVDVDEIILPRSYSSLAQFVQDNYEQNSGMSLCFKMQSFTNSLIDGNGQEFNLPSGNSEDGKDTIPFMMTKVHSVPENFCSDTSVKCLHDPRSVFLIHNHYPRLCLARDDLQCAIDVDANQAYIHHHRAHCEPKFELGVFNPKHLFSYDPSILRFRKELITRRDNAFKKIFANKS